MLLCGRARSRRSESRCGGGVLGGGLVVRGTCLLDKDQKIREVFKSWAF